MKGISEGLTDFQRVIYLTTMLKFKEKEKFLSVVNDLLAYVKGKQFEQAFKQHIKQLESLNG